MGMLLWNREGTVLYAVVKNYSNQTVPAKHAFVTKISGDFDVVKVPITIGKGITRGMTEENMKLLLDGISPGKPRKKNRELPIIYTQTIRRKILSVFSQTRTWGSSGN